MAVARAEHTITALDNGKYLIAGGVDSGGTPLVSAEIFDPATGSGDQGTFAATGPLPSIRAGHAAVRVNLGAYGGEVVHFGGYQGTKASPAALNAAASFDRTANGFVGAFTAVSATMNSTRMGHTATMLTGGILILVAGGNNVNQPEIFDPYANALGAGIHNDAGFSRTKDGAGADTAMTAVTNGRSYHAAAWMNNGTVLLCGGEDGGTVIGTAEIFNP
jgi:hypothetical protein